MSRADWKTLASVRELSVCQRLALAGLWSYANLGVVVGGYFGYLDQAAKAYLLFGTGIAFASLANSATWLAGAGRLPVFRWFGGVYALLVICAACFVIVQPPLGVSNAAAG